ncbi:serine/threonine-protein kinase PLK1, partial [Biomphalaria glabrata]
ALGCVAVEMLTGDFPFAKYESQQVNFFVLEEKTPLQFVEQKLPILAEQFLTKIFKYKPEDRPLALNLLQNDPYIT